MKGKDHEQKISRDPILSFLIWTCLIFNDTPLQEKEGHNNTREAHSRTMKQKKKTNHRNRKKEPQQPRKEECSVNPNIITNILQTVHYIFPRMLTRRICLTIRSFFHTWSFPLFSWPSRVIGEALSEEIRRWSLEGVKGLRELLN